MQVEENQEGLLREIRVEPKNGGFLVTVTSEDNNVQQPQDSFGFNMNMKPFKTTDFVTSNTDELLYLIQGLLNKTQ